MADIGKISSSEYAIDSNVSRLTWIPVIPKLLNEIFVRQPVRQVFSKPTWHRAFFHKDSFVGYCLLELTEETKVGLKGQPPLTVELTIQILYT